MDLKWRVVEMLPWAILALIGVFSMLHRRVRADNYEDCMRWGQIAMNLRDGETAARRFASAARYARQASPAIKPGALSEALLLQAQAFQSVGKPRQALALVEEGLRVDFEAHRGQLRLLGASLCSSSGQHERVEEMLRPIMDLTVAVEPNVRARAFMETGRARVNRGRSEEAIPILGEAMALFEASSADRDSRHERAKTLATLAIALDKTGQKEESRRAAEQSLAGWSELEAAGDGYPSWEFLQYEMGLMHEIRGDPASAMQHWIKAVPSHSERLANGNQAVAGAKLAAAYLESGRIVDADREAERLVEYLARSQSHGKHSRALQSRARAARIMGLYQEAEQLFRSGIKVSLESDPPKYRSAVVIWNDVAIMQIRRMEWERAIAALDEAGPYLAKLTQPDPALAALLLNNRGVALRWTGAANEAMECWQEAAAITRELPGGSDIAAMNLLSYRAKQGDQEAFDLFVAKALEAKDDDQRLPWWFSDIAFCLITQGRAAEAQQNWDRARELAFQQAADVDVRPAEFLEFCAVQFEESPWREQVEIMRRDAAEFRAKVARKVDDAFPGRRPLG
jgi:tetratricopeptide (TPR) repeat protein